MVAGSAVDEAYALFSLFAAVGDVVSELPFLAVIAVAADIGVDADVVAVDGIFVAGILGIVVVEGEDRVIRCEESRSEISASLVVACVFDKTRREPIRWWWKTPFRRRPACFCSPNAVRWDAMASGEPPCRVFP